MICIQLLRLLLYYSKCSYFNIKMIYVLKPFVNSKINKIGFIMTKNYIPVMQIQSEIILNTFLNLLLFFTKSPVSLTVLNTGYCY